MRDIQRFIKLGLDRDVPELLRTEYDEGGLPPLELNLGPGDSKKIPGTVGVGYGKLADMHWWAPDPLPFYEGTVDVVHAYHFFEHLTGDDAIATLREVERVLARGGYANIVTPHGLSDLQAQVLDHKSTWTEETWHTLFDNPYFNDTGHEWRLRVHACFLAGVVHRNLCVFTQLQKD